MAKKETTKEEKIQLLHEWYGWDTEALRKHNDAQLETLISSCQDEDGNMIPKAKK